MRGAWRAARRATARLAGLARELHYAQQRMTALRLAPDRHDLAGARAPETYREFLARTRAPLLREPSARARLAGRRVG